jgi:hypothetical protein
MRVVFVRGDAVRPSFMHCDVRVDSAWHGGYDLDDIHCKVMVDVEPHALGLTSLTVISVV